MASQAIGLVGFGYWGPKYLRVLREHPATSAAFVVDPDGRRLRQLKGTNIPTFRTVKEAIDRVTVDGVIVVTPASTHRSVAEICLRHGIKTLVEKPLSPRLKDAAYLVRLSHELGVTLYPGNIYAHNDAVKALCSYVKAPPFGPIRYLYSARTGLGPIRGDVSALWDLTPHDLTISQSLGMGRPEGVVAVGSSFLRPGIEDVVFGTLKYAEGVLGHIQGSWLSPYKVRQTTVVGTHQMAVFDDTASEDPLRIYGRGVDLLPTDAYGIFKTQIRSGDVNMPFIQLKEPMRNMVEEFLIACKDSHLAREEVQRALDIVAILESMEKSMKSGGRPMTINWDSVPALEG